MGVNESIQTNEKYYGFRIFKLNSGGPLEKANLKIIEDFIIPPKEMFEKRLPFSEWIKEKADQTINLTIYNLPTRKLKEVEIKVNPLNSKEGYLGGSVRFENYIDASKKLLHILSVKENSFAKNKLKLIPKEDYLIAIRPDQSDITSLNKNNCNNPLELFGDLIKMNLGKECEFFIYNYYKGGRIVSAKLDQNQFFEMGCDAAYGKIHEFPYILDSNDEEVKKLKEEMGEMQNV